MESHILADIFENVRSLTKFSIRMSSEIDSHQRFEINGQRLNSRLWLIAHLVWTEHQLLVKGIVNKHLDIT